MTLRTEDALAYVSALKGGQIKFIDSWGLAKMWEIEAWKSVLQEPDRVFAEQRPKASTKVALVWVALMGVLSYAATGLVNTNLSLALGLAVFGLVFAPIMFLASSGIVYLFAKLLGGNGVFREQAYLTAVASVPVGFLSVIVTLFSKVPIVNIVGLVALLGLLCYSVYLQVKIFKLVHGLSTGRALLALILPGIILAVLLVIVIVVFAGAAYALFDPTLANSVPIMPAA